jgi:hypothetical protein
VDAARVGGLARLSKIPSRLELRDAFCGVDLLDRYGRYRREDALSDIFGHAVIIGAKADNLPRV